MMLQTAAFVLIHPFLTTWAWMRRHPRLATVLVVMLVFYIAGWVVEAPHAFAAEGSGSDVEGDHLLSSMGIPASHYHALFVNRGDVWTSGQMFWSSFADYAWGFHYDVVVASIDTFVWLLSFAWIDIIATPMEGIAKLVTSILDQLGVMNFALFLSGAVAAVLLAFMKVSRAIVEVVLATIIAVSAGGVLANPVEWLTSDDGPIEKAQMYGSQLSAAMLSDDGKIGELEAESEDIIGAAMEAKLVDLFIVAPAEEVSFGHRITGDCKTVLEAAVMAVDPIKQGDNSVRDAVGACDSKAKDWSANTGPTHYFNAASYSTSSISLLVVSYLISLVLICAILATLFAALQVTWRAVLSVFPFTNRGKLVNSVALAAAGVLFVVTMQLILAGYWSLLDKSMALLAEAGIPIVMQLRALTFFEIALVILLIIVFANHRRVAKVLAERSERRMQALKLAGVGIPLAGLPMANELKTYAMHRMAMRRAHGDESEGEAQRELGNVTFNNIHVVSRPGSRRRGPVNGGDYQVVDPESGRASGGSPGGGGGAGRAAVAAGSKATKVALTAGRYAKALSAGPAGVAAELAKDTGKAAVGAVARRRISVDRDGVGRVMSPGTSTGRPSQAPAPGGSFGGQRQVPGSAGPRFSASRRVVIGNDGVGKIVHETTSVANRPAVRSAAAVARAARPVRELTS